MKDVGSWSSRRNEENVFRPYTHNLDNAREAQAKAISFDADLYIAYLAEIVNIGKSRKRFNSMNIGLLLLATPRQTSEASYLTLQEVQGQ